MILCLSCRRVSPSGSKYCTSCGTGLGCRFCENGGHPAPLSAEACPTCGTFDLSDGGRAVSLTPLARLLAVVVAVWVWKAWLLPHLPCIAAFAASIAVETAAFLTNTTACHIQHLISSLLLLVGFLWLLGQVLAAFPQNGRSVGKFLRDLPATLFRLAWHRVLPKTLGWLWSVLVRVIVPIQRRDRESAKQAQGKKG